MTNLFFRRVARHRETRILSLAIDPFHDPAALAPGPRQRVRDAGATQLDDPVRTGRGRGLGRINRWPRIIVPGRYRAAPEDLRWGALNARSGLHVCSLQNRRISWQISRQMSGVVGMTPLAGSNSRQESRTDDEQKKEKSWRLRGKVTRPPVSTRIRECTVKPIAKYSAQP